MYECYVSPNLSSQMTRAANEMEAEVPKALGDVFESLAGAVFLDAGLCLNTLWRIFFPLLRERIGTFTFMGHLSYGGLGVN